VWVRCDPSLRASTMYNMCGAWQPHQLSVALRTQHCGAVACAQFLSVGHLCSARHVPELVLKGVLHSVVLILDIEQLVHISLVLHLGSHANATVRPIAAGTVHFTLLHVPTLATGSHTEVLVVPDQVWCCARAE
jgi:hypothetical protein